MAMSSDDAPIGHTQHAFLVAWGRFAREVGLIQKIETVELSQKKYYHTPQTKVLEFLVAHLAGLKHLQDISLSAHPLDKDQAVAEAWEQPVWADYTGVSRTLSSLSWDEAHQIVRVLQEVSQPFLETEIRQILEHGQRLCFDGDLTGIPVSNTSQSYPHAAYGHMDDEIRLGYQAALVSLASPTYRRLWLSVEHHPGDTVSCTQAEALVRAAEARTGLRPRRRVEMLRQRLATFEQQLTDLQQRLHQQERAVAEAQARIAQAGETEVSRKRLLDELEHDYRVHQRQERPTSRLAQARQRFQTAQRKRVHRETVLQEAQRRLARTQARWAEQQAELSRLQQRVTQFEQDNATQAHPIEADFRLDAGFGTYDNVALLIEMGYEVYTKAHSHQVVRYLKGQVDDQTTWTRVGANADMVAWSHLHLKGCPYPLDVALERFHTGKTVKHSALFHFGTDSVTQDLAGWFDHYNGRQLIEAGVKEGKQVFHLHRIKVRSEPAIYLQEQFIIFAANLVRWATRWLANPVDPAENALDVSRLGVTKQVQVAAHVSAEVIRISEGWLLRFGEHTAFAGKVLKLPGGGSPSGRDAQKSSTFLPFSIESHLIAQPLG
jgi:hypothetical protein